MLNTHQPLDYQGFNPVLQLLIDCPIVVALLFGVLHKTVGSFDDVSQRDVHFVFVVFIPFHYNLDNFVTAS
jgi:hypothetical protein